MNADGGRWPKQQWGIQKIAEMEMIEEISMVMSNGREQIKDKLITYKIIKIFRCYDGGDREINYFLYPCYPYYHIIIR